MKARWLVLAVVGFGATLAWTNAARSGEEDDKAAAGGPSMEEMQKAMEEWMASMKPGDNHKRLNQFVGEWNAEFKMYMQGPGSDPIVTKGTSTIKWVLGGRYLQEEYKGEMLNPMTGQKMPYEGIGMQGYNNTRNIYEGTWASSMDTSIYTMKGTWPPNSNVINMYGEMDEPMMKMYGRTVNYRTTVVDKDTRKFEIFDLAAGPDFKVIEIMYTRK